MEDLTHLNYEMPYLTQVGTFSYKRLNKKKTVFVFKYNMFDVP